MAKKIEVIAEIIPAGDYPVVSAENVKVGEKKLDEVAAQIPSIVVSNEQPQGKNCLWIQPIN